MRNSDYENFQKSKSDIKPQIPEAQRTSSRTNDQKITPKNIIFKLQNSEDKNTSHTEEQRRITSDFLGTMQARKK